MEKITSYKQLNIWQDGIILVEKVYEITKKFPKEEMYGLTSQVRRASVSIPSNIAEGFKRFHPKEHVNFLRISQGSLAELETELIIAGKLNYAPQDIINELLLLTESISKRISKSIIKINQF
jgi:four helix bundle protein